MKQPNDLEGGAPVSPTREQLLARVEAELEGVRIMQRARRWAPCFMREYSIAPHGVELIPWFARSRCRCNAEALVEWIEVQLEDPSLTEGAGFIPQSMLVAHRLEARLALIEESCPW